MTISDTKFLSPKELTERPMRMRKSDVLRVTAYTVGGSSYSGSATTNRKQLEKGQADLREEVSRTLLKLPTFVPARRAGQAVEDTQVKLIYFAIE
ncbi:MAG: hypothetical protein WA952_16470 [Lewinella sp.]